MSAYISN